MHNPKVIGRDIENPADLDALLRNFYGRVFADDLLRHIFVDVVAMDLEEHLPAISAFWERVLLGTGQYRGQPLAQHRAVHGQVPLTAEHFRRWLTLWRAALADHFTGPIAARAYSHAVQTASNFLQALSVEQPARSLRLLQPPGDPS